MADFYTDHDVAPRLAILLHAMGHDVVTTRQLGLTRAGDEEQLLTAAQQQRVFVTHSGDDFLLLHRAWRLCSRSCLPTPPPEHAGILVIPQAPRLGHHVAARALDGLVKAGVPLANELYRWRHGSSWTRSR